MEARDRRAAVMVDRVQRSPPAQRFAALTRSEYPPMARLLAERRRAGAVRSQNSAFADRAGDRLASLAPFFDLERRQFSFAMRAGEDFQRAVACIAVVEVDAQSNHAFEHG